jgi:hypothetical protein
MLKVELSAAPIAQPLHTQSPLLCLNGWRPCQVLQGSLLTVAALLPAVNGAGEYDVTTANYITCGTASVTQLLPRAYPGRSVFGVSRVSRTCPGNGWPACAHVRHEAAVAAAAAAANAQQPQQQP